MCDVFLIDDESDIRIALAQSFELADLNAQFFASVEEAHCWQSRRKDSHW